MDLVDFSGLPYPAMPPEARVALIIAKYAVFGMIPLVIPSLFTDIPLPIDRIPIHKGTDLDYLKLLAREVGYVFYLDPGPAPGTNIAYWGPEIKIGVPQPALNLDMDPYTNVESLSFSFNSANTTLPIVFIQNQLTEDTDPYSHSQAESAPAAVGRDSSPHHQGNDAEGHSQALPDAGHQTGPGRGLSFSRCGYR